MIVYHGLAAAWLPPVMLRGLRRDQASDRLVFVADTEAIARRYAARRVAFTMGGRYAADHLTIFRNHARLFGGRMEPEQLQRIDDALIESPDLGAILVLDVPNGWLEATITGVAPAPWGDTQEPDGREYAIDADLAPDRIKDVRTVRFPQLLAPGLAESFVLQWRFELRPTSGSGWHSDARAGKAR